MTTGTSFGRLVSVGNQCDLHDHRVQHAPALRDDAWLILYYSLTISHRDPSTSRAENPSTAGSIDETRCAQPASPRIRNFVPRPVSAAALHGTALIALHLASLHCTPDAINGHILTAYDGILAEGLKSLIHLETKSANSFNGLRNRISRIRSASNGRDAIDPGTLQTYMGDKSRVGDRETKGAIATTAKPINSRHASAVIASDGEFLYDSSATLAKIIPRHLHKDYSAILARRLLRYFVMRTLFRNTSAKIIP